MRAATLVLVALLSCATNAAADCPPFPNLCMQPLPGMLHLSPSLALAGRYPLVSALFAAPFLVGGAAMTAYRQEQGPKSELPAGVVYEADPTSDQRLPRLTLIPPATDRYAARPHLRLARRDRALFQFNDTLTHAALLVAAPAAATGILYHFFKK